MKEGEVVYYLISQSVYLVFNFIFILFIVYRMNFVSFLNTLAGGGAVYINVFV